MGWKSALKESHKHNATIHNACHSRKKSSFCGLPWSSHPFHPASFPVDEEINPSVESGHIRSGSLELNIQGWCAAAFLRLCHVIYLQAMLRSIICNWNEKQKGSYFSLTPEITYWPSFWALGWYVCLEGGQKSTPLVCPSSPHNMP